MKILKSVGKGCLIGLTVLVSVWAIPIGGHMWAPATIKLITKI